MVVVLGNLKEEGGGKKYASVITDSPYLTPKSSESCTAGPREPWLDRGSRTGRYRPVVECLGDWKNGLLCYVDMIICVCSDS